MVVETPMFLRWHDTRLSVGGVTPVASRSGCLRATTDSEKRPIIKAVHDVAVLEQVCMVGMYVIVVIAAVKVVVVVVVVVVIYRCRCRCRCRCRRWQLASRHQCGLRLLAL